MWWSVLIKHLAQTITGESKCVYLVLTIALLEHDKITGG